MSMSTDVTFFDETIENDCEGGKELYLEKPTRIPGTRLQMFDKRDDRNFSIAKERSSE